MARIEYLINNPTEVEGNDLDLLNQEIEKYPYFYSLRALKLLALKKANNPEYANYLPITSLFSSNRKGLFHLVNNPDHVEKKKQEEVTSDVDPIIEDSENTSEIDDEKTAIEAFEILPIFEETIPENLVLEHSDNELELNVIEEVLVEDFPIKVEEELEDKNALQLYEEIIENFPIPETTPIELVNFAIPNQEEQKNIQDSIENSLQVANEILDHSSRIENAISETNLISEPKLEQVGLINRTSNKVTNSTVLDTDKKNVHFSPFVVLNTNDEIKRNTVFIVSDNQLEELILEENSPIFMASEQEIEEISVVDEVNNLEILEIKPSNQINESNLEVEKSIEINGSFSFNEWLNLPVSNPIEISSEIEQKYQIIDDFLEKNPKIKPIKKLEHQETYIPKQTDFSDLMTETLAQIYIEQKQYEKAIKAYKILSLKYPEKNSLFAKQIKEIENLKNSK